MKLEQCINFTLAKTQQSIQQLFKAELLPHGVTPGQYAVLQCLWDEDGQTPTQLSERLFLDSSSMTGVLDRLEQKGLIERKPILKDRRALQVMLTDRGRQLKEPVLQAIKEANQKALANLSVEDAKILKQLLGKLLN
ncbi:MAG: MarR family winged helix-turn-helix transcriptional regulator [Desulfitobacterium sp.]